MEANELTAVVREEIGAREHVLRIRHPAQVTVAQFLGALARKYPHLKGKSLVASAGGELLEPTRLLWPALAELGLASPVRLVVCEETAHTAESVGRDEPASGAGTAAAPADPLGETRVTSVLDIVAALRKLVPSTPARYQQKNERVLADVAAGRTSFPQLGPLLVNWCDDDIGAFSDEEVAVLIEALVWFVEESAAAPEDAAYNALIAASHVPAKLPWSDGRFRESLVRLVSLSGRHIRGGEGTAYAQRALERLAAYRRLPDPVRAAVECALDSLWTATHARERGGVAAIEADEDVPGAVTGTEPVQPAPAREPAPLARGDPVGSASRVALLIDLENLVYGLRAEYGDEAVGRMVDVEALQKLARQFGDVAVVHAYADWKYRIINQFQRQLYHRGVELVHVLGTGRKNASDLRMAIDVTDLIWTRPEVETFVIVSGDRDFLEILKKLRSHGKCVVGIASDGSVGRGFAGLFDHFIPYGEVCRRFGSRNPAVSAAPSGAAARQAPDPAGNRGAAGLDPAAGGAPGSREGAREPPAAVRELMLRGQLGGCRFELDLSRRRSILGAIHDAMSARERFTWKEVHAALASARHDLALTATVLSKYQAVLYQGGAFRFVHHEGAACKPAVRERRAYLTPEAREKDAMVEAYELEILRKVLARAGRVVTIEDALGLLGFDAFAPRHEDREYCRRLLARTQAGGTCEGRTAEDGPSGALP